MRRTLGSALLGLAAALPAAAPVPRAQDPSPAAEFERPQPVADPGSRGLRAIRRGDRVVGLDLGGTGFTLPLARPVRDWDVATLGADELVVLAGGLREPLDLYLVDRSRDRFVHHRSEGLRLSRRFAQGLGSWPLVAGDRSLLLFAFEIEDQVELRVLDPQGQVVARTQEPLAACDRLVVERDAVSEVLRVTLGGDLEPLEFVDLQAGRLLLEPGSLAFAAGERSEQTVEVRNDGGRPLRLEARIEGEGFVVVGSPQRILAPDTADRFRVVALGGDAGGTARLHIRSPVRGAAGSVRLRQPEIVRPEPDPEPVATPPPPDVAAATRAEQPIRTDPPVPAEEDIATETAAPEPPPAPPDPALLRLLRLETRAVPPGGSRLWAEPLPGEHPLTLMIREGDEGEAVPVEWSPERPLDRELSFAGGSRLTVWIDGQPDAGRALQVLPALRWVDEGLELRATPGAEVLLLGVLLGEDEEHSWGTAGSWRVHLDAQGRAVVPRTSLPQGERLAFSLLVADRGGLRRSPLLRPR